MQETNTNSLNITYQSQVDGENIMKQLKSSMDVNAGEDLSLESLKKEIEKLKLNLWNFKNDAYRPF